MEEFNIECEECESTAIVLTYDNPNFCPICGRRAEIEKRRSDLDEPESIFE